MSEVSMHDVQASCVMTWSDISLETTYDKLCSTDDSQNLLLDVTPEGALIGIDMVQHNEEIIPLL